MCCSSWESKPEEINGECKDCGEPTVDGEAAFGCTYSPKACETCGWQPCDWSC